MAENFLRRGNSILLAAIEAAPGTPETLDGDTDAVATVGLLPPTPNTTIIDLRTDLASLDPDDPIAGRQLFTANFTTPLKGSGAAGTAPDIGPLLQACGFNETIVALTSVTYERSSAAPPALTLGFYIDGVRWLLTYCRGNAAFRLLNADDLWWVDWTFQGRFSAVADVALPGSITVDATTPVAWLGGTCTLGGAAIAANEVSFDMNNEIVAPHDPNDSESIATIEIVNRQLQGTLAVPGNLVANRNNLSDLRAGTTRALVATNGGTAGNITTVNATLRFRDLQYNENNSLVYESLPFQIIGRDAANFSLVFT